MSADGLSWTAVFGLLILAYGWWAVRDDKKRRGW